MARHKVSDSRIIHHGGVGRGALPAIDVQENEGGGHAQQPFQYSGRSYETSLLVHTSTMFLIIYGTMI